MADKIGRNLICRQRHWITLDALFPSLVARQRCHFDSTVTALFHWSRTSFLRLDSGHKVRSASGRCDLYFINFSYHYFRFISMLFHSMFFSQRVGEAGNPGPDMGTIRLAVSNPTVIYKKVPELLKFGANIITTSETSATSIVQKDVSHEFNKHGFRSHWCPPVAPKKSKLPTVGLAIGEKHWVRVFLHLYLHVLPGLMSHPVFVIHNVFVRPLSGLVRARSTLFAFMDLLHVTWKGRGQTISFLPLRRNMWIWLGFHS